VSGLLFVAAASRRFQTVCTASAHLSHKTKINIADALIVGSLRASASSQDLKPGPRLRSGPLCVRSLQRGAL